jgi:hypothetical protein
MSDLENYINKKRADFDGQLPTEGHRERFLARLERDNKRPKGLLFTLWRAAAVAIVVVAVGAALLLPRLADETTSQQASLSLGEVSADLGEVEYYYQQQIELALLRLDNQEGNEDLIESYEEELDRLEEAYKSLENQLYTSGAHEAVITAMIENFRLRLDLIEQLGALQNDSNIQNTNQP